MTYAAVPVLASNPNLSAIWNALLASREYDFRQRPHAQKSGMLAGMALTKKQGGSDLRSHTTAAGGGPIEGGQICRLTGHKWFCSAPMSDMFLILEQAPAGPSCFLVPRVLDDGTRDPIALQRLKDKLGNRSNASAEIELDGTWCVCVDQEGRGIRTVLDMVAATRLGCILGSSATMRQALVRAIHHTRHRQAFGRWVVDQPTDAQCPHGPGPGIRSRHHFGSPACCGCRRQRHGVLPVGGRRAVGKYWVCKRETPMVAKALECLGEMALSRRTAWHGCAAKPR